MPANSGQLESSFIDAVSDRFFFCRDKRSTSSLCSQSGRAWGEFSSSFGGVLEVELAGGKCLAPPGYGVWLPPGSERKIHSRSNVRYCSLYVSESVCASMPSQVGVLSVSPLGCALLSHLCVTPELFPLTVESERLLQVLVDQLAQAGYAESYLPTTDDKILRVILDSLETNPGDNRSIFELARSVNVTERTLMRRCQRELGMTLNEWRQRLKVITAFSLLEEGRKIEAVAFYLGYRNASAFIAMFRRIIGVAPDEFRKNISRKISNECPSVE